MQISSLPSSSCKVPNESKWRAFSIRMIQIYFNHAVLIRRCASGLCCFVDIIYRFVQTWVFKGVCNDRFGEFMIEMDEQYLAYRGK